MVELLSSSLPVSEHGMGLAQVAAGPHLVLPRPGLEGSVETALSALDAERRR